MTKEVITQASCRSCGLCCVSLNDQEGFCGVSEKDLKRLDPKWVRKNVLDFSTFDVAVAALSGRRLPSAAIQTRWSTQKSGPLKGVQACACAALRGSLLHKTSCSIYDQRPDVCRKAVKPGDRSCRYLRKLYADSLETT